MGVAVINDKQIHVVPGLMWCEYSVLGEFCDVWRRIERKVERE